MSELRSQIAEAVSFDPDDLSVDELAAEISEALHGQQQLEVAVVGWVKNLTDRGTNDDDEGHEPRGGPFPTAPETGHTDTHVQEHR